MVFGCDQYASEYMSPTALQSVQNFKTEYQPEAMDTGALGDA